MQFLTTLLFFLLTTSLATASCDFVSADYIDELRNPKFINSIKVTIPKNSKFTREFLKIVVSKSNTISPKLKSNFRAKVDVNYTFGTCSYKAKVKQNGDWKDHVTLLPGGKMLRSLNVKLREGNILNAVKFKLLIPKTRGDLNEVFATVVFRALGIIAPETFKVDVDINGVQTAMIFQEDAKKELLERNSRREGPIFEGDETLVWGPSGRLFQNDHLILARSSNKNWFLKGETSAYITMQAYKRLQLAYLTVADNVESMPYYIQVNKNFHNIFLDFSFLSVAFQAEHGLVPHNRRFYFNVFLDEFEPIYYDGNVKLDHIRVNESAILNSDYFRYSFSNGYKFPFFEKLDDPVIYEKIISNFVSRSNLNSETGTSMAKGYLSKFKYNAQYIQSLIDKSEISANYEEIKSISYDAFITRVQESGNQQKHVVEVKNILNGAYPIMWKDGTSASITPDQLADIITNASYGEERAVLIDNNLIPKRDKLTIEEFNSGNVIKSAGIELDINKSLKKIHINQSSPKDWVLFIQNDLSDWTVKFTGKSGEGNTQAQRFNEFGMTGCLNFFEVTFAGASIETNHGNCEDSVNIVKSNGVLSNITVRDAMSDAIDIDFSNVKIDRINVDLAGNDCFDVSGGSYEIETFLAKNCGDKGISVGESSRLVAETVRLEQALMGISSKDLSQVTINKADLSQVQICYEAAQKKQEFGGGNLKIKTIKCMGETMVDEASSASVDFQ